MQTGEGNLCFTAAQQVSELCPLGNQINTTHDLHLKNSRGTLKSYSQLQLCSFDSRLRHVVAPDRWSDTSPATRDS